MVVLKRFADVCLVATVAMALGCSTNAIIHVIAQARRAGIPIDLDDFEKLLLDKPRDEKWELINGRVVRSMVGGRTVHALP